MLTDRDESPLHIACANGRAETARYLHSCGAKLDLHTVDHKTPFAAAFRGGHISVVTFLRSCGVAEHIHSGRTSERFEQSKSLPAPKAKPKRTIRTTPMKLRAERAGVLHRYKDISPGLLDRAQGLASEEFANISEEEHQAAAKELQKLQKHNQQIVNRAEIAASANKLPRALILQADANRKKRSRREKTLDNKLQNALDEGY